MQIGAKQHCVYLGWPLLCRRHFNSQCLLDVHYLSFHQTFNKYCVLKALYRAKQHGVLAATDMYQE